MSEEMDVIQHLLEIEKEASETLIKAQEEADKKIASARTQSDSQFKNQFTAYTKELDESLSAQKEIIRNEQDTRLTNFKNELNSSKKDYEGFNSLLEKLIYA